MTPLLATGMQGWRHTASLADYVPALKDPRESRRAANPGSENSWLGKQYHSHAHCFISNVGTPAACSGLARDGPEYRHTTCDSDSRP
jgi:hypothetical protein